MQQITVKRPLFLSIICVLGFIWVVLSLPGVFAPSVKKINDWLPALLGLVRASMFISLIGVWYMKQWGVRMFIATMFLKETVYFLIGDTSYLGAFLSLVFVISMLPHYKKMSLNL